MARLKCTHDARCAFLSPEWLWTAGHREEEAEDEQIAASVRLFPPGNLFHVRRVAGRHYMTPVAETSFARIELSGTFVTDHLMDSYHGTRPLRCVHVRSMPRRAERTDAVCLSVCSCPHGPSKAVGAVRRRCVLWTTLVNVEP